MKHFIDVNSKMNNVSRGFSFTVSLHVSGGRVVVRVASISQCALHSFEPCQFYEQYQDEIIDPTVFELKSGHLLRCCHGDNMQRHQIKETFNDAFTFLYQQLSISYQDEMIDVKNEKLAAFYTENLTHQQIYKSFNQCCCLTNIDTLTNQTVSDKEPEGFLLCMERLFISVLLVLSLILLVTFLISRKTRKPSDRISKRKEENDKHLQMTENVPLETIDNTASTCHLKKENHSQFLDIITKSIGNDPVTSSLNYSVLNKSSQSSSSAPLQVLYSGNVSWIKDTNIKELQMERVRSWLNCNPNSEEFPSAEGESHVVSSVG